MKGLLFVAVFGLVGLCPLSAVAEVAGDHGGAATSSGGATNPLIEDILKNPFLAADSCARLRYTATPPRTPAIDPIPSPAPKPYEPKPAPPASPAPHSDRETG
jgi:hypothetical protein